MKHKKCSAFQFVIMLQFLFKCLVSNQANISNFFPLKVVGRGSETQHQVVENLNKIA